MFGDPDFFDIETLKQMQMWPSDKMVSKEMTPYIKRMKKAEVQILEVGIKKGENAVDLCDRCGCVKSYYGVEQNAEYDAVLKKNTATLGDKFKMVSAADLTKDSIDLLIFDSDCNFENLFEKYYGFLRPNGIVCGNEHSSMKVKAALTTTRRKNRIGTPINIATNTVWFWYKR